MKETILSKMQLICMWWIFCEWVNIGDFTTGIAPVPILLLYKRHVHHGVVNSTDTHSYSKTHRGLYNPIHYQESLSSWWWMLYYTKVFNQTLSQYNLYWLCWISAWNHCTYTQILFGRNGYWQVKPDKWRCLYLHS